MRLNFDSISSPFYIFQLLFLPAFEWIKTGWGNWDTCIVCICAGPNQRQPTFKVRYKECEARSTIHTHTLLAV